MMLTEEQAKTKWCPFARQATGLDGHGPAFNRSAFGWEFCVASACMAWRWGHFIGPDGWTADRKCDSAPDPTHGYCGLAGKVEGIP